MFSKARTCSYPKPDKSSPHSASLLRFHSKHYHSNHVYVFQWSISAELGTKPQGAVLFYHTCATCPAHFILLDLIAQIIRHRFSRPPSSAWSWGYNPEDGAASSSETLVPLNQYKRRHVPEERNIHQYQYEDPKYLGIVQPHVFQSA